MHTETAAIDADLVLLTGHKHEWARLPLSVKIAFLDEVRRLTIEHAEEWARVGTEGKGISPDSVLAGEEWLAGPMPVLRWTEAIAATLTAIDEGQDPLDGLKSWQRDNGQVAVRVYPADLVEQRSSCDSAR